MLYNFGRHRLHPRSCLHSGHKASSHQYKEAPSSSNGKAKQGVETGLGAAAGGGRWGGPLAKRFVKHPGSPVTYGGNSFAFKKPGQSQRAANCPGRSREQIPQKFTDQHVIDTVFVLAFSRWL